MTIPRTSTTRVRLVRLRAALLIGTLVMLVTSLWAVRIVQDTAETVRDRTTEAVLETAAARAALTAADRAAITSFASGDIALAGPGQDYTNRLATANQSLAKVAEANQAEGGAGRLQVVAGLVAAYAGAIGQADAHYRQEGSKKLGAADLWYASRLLHGADGVLAQLADLQAAQHTTLLEQLDQGSPVLIVPLWLAPVALLVPILLLVLLGLAQWWLYRWFRRRLNPWLLGATVVTAGIVVALGLLLGQRGRLDDVPPRTDIVLADRQAEIAQNDTEGQRLLEQLLKDQCDRTTGCGVTLEEFVATRQPGGPGAAQDLIDADTQRVTAGAATAADSGGREFWVPAAVLVVAGLVLLGLYRRIDEYRYHA